MKINIQGVVKSKLPVMEKGNFKKQTLVLTSGTNDIYAIDFLYDSIDWLTNISSGSLVNINCYIKVNEYNGNYFTSIVAQTIKVYQATESYNNTNSNTEQGQPNQASQDFSSKSNDPYSALPTSNPNDAFSNDDDDDDLPF